LIQFFSRPRTRIWFCKFCGSFRCDHENIFLSTRQDELHVGQNYRRLWNSGIWDMGCHLISLNKI